MTDNEILSYYYIQMNVIEWELMAVKSIWDFGRIDKIERDKKEVWENIQILEEKIRKKWSLLNNQSNG